MSENVGRSASPAAPPRRTLRAPAAALMRVQKVLPVAAAGTVPSPARQAHDKTVESASAPSDQAKDLPVDPELAARRKERNERRNALALTLRARWPDLFTGPFTPWAVGIHHQIVAALECDVKDLRVALSGWSGSLAYQKALLAEGAQRRNLDGSVADLVTQDQRDHAVERLAQVKAAHGK
jgi:hypothetical protein